MICLLLWERYTGIDKDLRNSQLKLKYKTNQEILFFENQTIESYVKIKWPSCSLS